MDKAVKLAIADNLYVVLTKHAGVYAKNLTGLFIRHDDTAKAVQQYNSIIHMLQDKLKLFLFSNDLTYTIFQAWGQIIKCVA